MSSSPQHEPTMEEILASIRKIISDDTADSAETPAFPVPVEESDVLELTQEVEPAPHAEPAPTPPPPSPPAATTDGDVVFETIEEPAMNHETPHSEIFSDHTRRAIDDAFANLPEDNIEPPKSRAATPIAPVDGASVENVFERAVRESFDPVLHQYLNSNADAVLERMKPMIREWMDEHFPALLEGVVRAEVERVLKARGKR